VLWSQGVVLTPDSDGTALLAALAEALRLFATTRVELRAVAGAVTPDADGFLAIDHALGELSDRRNFGLGPVAVLGRWIDGVSVAEGR
jgi:hypothetical protein